jgi:hypothetical protein
MFASSPPGAFGNGLNLSTVRANQVAAAVDKSSMNIDTWMTACRLLELHNRKRWKADACSALAIELLTRPIDINLFSSALGRSRSGRRVTLSYEGQLIASQIISTATKDELKKAFDVLDTDASGTLTLEDWIRDADTSENRELFQDIQEEFDIDGDQQVSFHEFEIKIFAWVIQQEAAYFRQKAGQRVMLAPFINDIHDRLNRLLVEKAKQVSKQHKPKRGDCILM